MNASGADVKSRVRDSMRARRRAVPASEREAASAAVSAKLAVHPGFIAAVARGRAIAVYLAIRDEIDLSAFILAALEKGARVAAPRWNGTAYELAEVKGLGPDSLREGPAKVPEPAFSPMVDPSEVGFWAVPGLAFARDGGRIGYGGGWYDRLLAGARADSVRLGVGYPFQLVDSLPVEPHDVPLTGAITG